LTAARSAAAIFWHNFCEGASYENVALVRRVGGWPTFSYFVKVGTAMSAIAVFFADPSKLALSPSINEVRLNMEMPTRAA